MGAVMGNMLNVLWWGAAVLVVLGVLLLLARLAEKKCFDRMIAAGGNQVSYEFWYDWDYRCEKATNLLLFMIFWAVAIFALVSVVFVGLTTWFQPVWE